MNDVRTCTRDVPLLPVPIVTFNGGLSLHRVIIAALIGYFRTRQVFALIHSDNNGIYNLRWGAAVSDSS